MDVLVTNPDGQEGSPKERFSYLGEPETGATTDAQAGATGAEGAVNVGVAASGADVETMDGCALEVVDETPDEDLPITEGGVE